VKTERVVPEICSRTDTRSHTDRHAYYPPHLPWAEHFLNISTTVGMKIFLM